MKIGITGPIASGKSTVARILCERFVGTLVDADIIGREVADNDPNLCEEIAKALGVPSLCTNGKLDRPATASIVFDDPKKLETLEKLIHPPMLVEISRRIDAAITTNVFLDAAVLLKWDIRKELDGILLVTAAPDIRKARLTAKGLASEEADFRMSAQGDWTEEESQCDWTLVNDGSDEDLEEKTLAWWKRVSEKQ